MGFSSSLDRLCAVTAVCSTQPTHPHYTADLKIRRWQGFFLIPSPPSRASNSPTPSMYYTLVHTAPNCQCPILHQLQMQMLFSTAALVHYPTPPVPRALYQRCFHPRPFHHTVNKRWKATICRESTNERATPSNSVHFQGRSDQPYLTDLDQALDVRTLLCPVRGRDGPPHPLGPRTNIGNCVTDRHHRADETWLAWLACWSLLCSCPLPV